MSSFASLFRSPIDRTAETNTELKNLIDQWVEVRRELKGVLGLISDIMGVEDRAALHCLEAREDEIERKLIRLEVQIDRLI